jgi:hypothetical protein
VLLVPRHQHRVRLRSHFQKRKVVRSDHSRCGMLSLCAEIPCTAVYGCCWLRWLPLGWRVSVRPSAGARFPCGFLHEEIRWAGVKDAGSNQYPATVVLSPRRRGPPACSLRQDNDRRNGAPGRKRLDFARKLPGGPSRSAGVCPAAQARCAAPRESGSSA